MSRSALKEPHPCTTQTVGEAALGTTSAATRFSGDSGQFSDDGCAASHAGQIFCHLTCVDPTWDVGNCGGCGIVCPGTPCDDGVCRVENVLVASGARGELRLDDDFVYFKRNRGLGRVPKAGGAATDLGSANARVFDVDDRYVYWVDDFLMPIASGPEAIAGLSRAPKDGSGTTELLANLGTFSAEDPTYFMALDGDFVYFVHGREGTVNRVAKSGGPVQVLARDQAYAEGISLYDGRVYFTLRGHVMKSVAMDGVGGVTPFAVASVEDFVFQSYGSSGIAQVGDSFVFGYSGVAVSVPKAGGPLHVLDTFVRPVGDFWSDGTRAYFIGEDDGVGGTGVATRAITPDGTWGKSYWPTRTNSTPPSGIALDRDSFYVAEGGRILRMPL